VAAGEIMTDNEHAPGQLQIGALAKATGLTVRTLRHYDAIGLLEPDERSYSGRRSYSQENVRRLYRIVALRRLGLSLDEIVGVLDRDTDLTEAVRQHLAHVEHGLALQQRLCRTLTRILASLELQHEPTLDQFIQAIEVMTVTEHYYTPEQLQQLENRRDELGEEGIRQGERHWAELIEAVKAEQAAGTQPVEPPMLELARRWRALIQQFTGGDEGIKRSLAAIYREQGPKAASQGTVDPELMQYVGQALAALPPAE
jgi:MerR family transcriptional regulator, thiopeptide resistance regulator